MAIMYIFYCNQDKTFYWFTIPLKDDEADVVGSN